MAGLAQSLFGARQFERVNIQGEEVAVGCNPLEDGLGVAAVTEGAVDGEVAGPGTTYFEGFRHHDRDVGPGGGFAGGENFGDGLGVVVRVEFFVFVGELSGVRSGVTRAAAVFLRLGRGV